MKNFILVSLLILFSFGVDARGRLQNEDFKSEAELISAGATKAQLLNDNKIYVTGNGINDTMYNAVTNGLLGGVPAWVSGSTYQVGRVVYYTDNNIYKCLTLNSDSTFDYAKWQSLGPVVPSVSSNGTNILANASFEKGVLNWTATGLAATSQTFTNGTPDDLKYAQIVATTASQTFCSDLATTPSYFGAGGMVDFSYTASGTKFLAYAADSSGNKLTSPQALLDQTTWTKISPIPFSFSTSQKLCFESVDAGTLQVNAAYLGSNKNVSSISQAKLFGSLKYAKNSGCSWSTASTSYVTMSANTSCLSPTISGQYTQAPATKIPAIVFSYMPAGDYLIIQRSRYITDSSSPSAIIMGLFNDGVQDYEELFLGYSGAGGDSSVAGSNSMIQKISLATPRTNVTIQGKYKTGSASNAFYMDGADTDFTIDVWYYPSSADQAQTPDVSKWIVDANIGGANPNLGASAITSYTEITDGSLDMVLNDGSATAQIGCASGTDSTGLTCSAANESIAATITNPYSGLFMACFSFGNYNDAAVNTVFEVVETTPTSSTPVQEGKVRLPSAVKTSAAGIQPVNVCGYFNFSDSRRRTIRLMREQGVSTANTIYADRSSSYGQQDIHFIMFPLLQGIPRGILNGEQISTHSQNNSEIFSFSYGTGSATTVCSSSPCSYLSRVGDRVLSVDRTSTGQYTANLNKTFSVLSCTQSVSDDVHVLDTANASCSNCSSISIYSRIPGVSAYDSHGTLICHGY